MLVLAVISGILFFLLLLLAIPVDLDFRFERDEDRASRVAIRWFFGFIDKNISTFRRKEKKKERKKEKRKGRIRPIFAMVKSRGFMNRCFRFIKEVLRKVDVREFTLYLRVGLDNPADTGLLFAAAYPALLCLQSFSSLDLQVEPDYHGENLRGFCIGNVRVFPIQIMGSFLLFALSPQTIRAVKAMIMERRR